MKNGVFNQAPSMSTGPGAPADHGSGGGGERGGDGGGSGAPSLGRRAPPSFGGGGNFDSDSVKWSSEICGDRVAQLAPFQYEEAKGGAWRISVRGYLVGACPEIASVLNWAEQQDGKIDQGDSDFITTRGPNLSIMGRLDKVVLSGLVWEFLQLCCINSTHASTTSQSAQPELNGLEVWRSLIWEINQGRSLRALFLRSSVQEPPMIKDLKGVSTAFDSYDIVLRDYKAAGGQWPCGHELRQSFISSQPGMLQGELVLKAACPKPYEAFKHNARSHIAFVMQRAGRQPGRGAHLFEPEPAAEKVEELDITGGINGELLAFVGRWDN